MLRFAIILFSAAHIAFAASLLEQRIDQLIRSSHGVEAGSAGIEVVQLATGKILYSHDSGKLLTPASNTKLFTTALALTRLGPDLRIQTRIYAQHAPDADGQIDGDLTIVGTGDPSMSFVQIPYQQDAPPADPMAAMEEFAGQLAAQGVRSISGGIVADDTAFPFEPFPPGWALEDATWEYGAPVSALSLGSNSVKLNLIPGTLDGDPTSIEIAPGLEYFVVDNRVRTYVGEMPMPDDRQLQVRRLPAGELVLSGAIPGKADPVTLWLAVDDPALYTATALQDALTRRGIAVRGQPSARHRYSGARVDLPRGPMLAGRTSPPLLELLRVTDKISQNLWAELMLRQVALVRTGDGSRRAGLGELKTFLKEIGIAEEDYVFEDGSGLSRVTLVKPSAITALLRFMHGSPHREEWLGLMPVGGEDGSLAKRFGKDPAARNIHAKTGSLSHVNALSGYADSATYGEVAFSIVVNHTSAPASEIREFIDRIGMALLE